jgi:hypothetical protein
MEQSTVVLVCTLVEQAPLLNNDEHLSPPLQPAPNIL